METEVTPREVGLPERDELALIFARRTGSRGRPEPSGLAPAFAVLERCAEFLIVVACPFRVHRPRRRRPQSHHRSTRHLSRSAAPSPSLADRHAVAIPHGALSCHYPSFLPIWPPLADADPIALANRQSAPVHGRRGAPFWMDGVGGGERERHRGRTRLKGSCSQPQSDLGVVRSAHNIIHTRRLGARAGGSSCPDPGGACGDGDGDRR